MSLYIVLTYHGTIICLNEADGALVHVSLGELKDGLQPLRCRLDAGQRLTIHPFSAHDCSSTSKYLIQTAPRAGTINLFRNGNYLHAPPNGNLNCDASNANEWEQFLLLSEPEFDLLQHAISNSWISTVTRRRFTGSDFEVLKNFQLRIGDDTVDLGPALPITSAPHQVPDRRSIMIYRDVWKIEELVLFKPLIYFCAFGSERQIDMISACIKSFELFHDIKIDIAVFTNLPEDLVRLKLSDVDDSKLHVCPVYSVDFVDYFLQRFRIDECPVSSKFQPLLYLDTDILFTANISSDISNIALSSKIEAVRENFSPILTSPSVGSEYLKLDPFIPSYEFGFNSGALGIPNIVQYRSYLHAVVEVVTRYGAVHGRAGLNWMDQPGANYVAAKLGGVGDGLTPLMENWSSDGTPSASLGLMHFWSARDKLAAMEAQLSAMQEASASN